MGQKKDVHEITCQSGYLLHVCVCVLLWSYCTLGSIAVFLSFDRVTNSSAVCQWPLLDSVCGLSVALLMAA